MPIVIPDPNDPPECQSEGCKEQSVAVAGYFKTKTLTFACMDCYVEMCRAIASDNPHIHSRIPGAF